MCDTKTLPHCFVWLKSDIFYLPGYTCFGFQSLINIWLNIKQMETRSGWSMIWNLNLDLHTQPRPNIYQTIWPPWILQKTYGITFLNGSRINIDQANPLMKKSRTSLMSPVHLHQSRSCFVFLIGLISKGFQIKIHIFRGQVKSPFHNHILLKW